MSLTLPPLSKPVPELPEWARESGYMTLKMKNSTRLIERIKAMAAIDWDEAVEEYDGEI